MKLAFVEDTSLEELGLSSKAIAFLRQRSICRLADFSEVTAREAAGVPGLGPKRLREVAAALRSLGMAFKQPKDPNKAAMLRNAERRRNAVRPTSLHAGTALEEIGVSSGLFERCIRRRLRSLGDVAALTVKELFCTVGRGQGREVLGYLNEAGLDLADHPGPIQLWHYGFVSREEVTFPFDPAARIEAWRPIIPKNLIGPLHRAGIRTVGELQAILPEVRARDRRIRGMGDKLITELFAILGSRRRGDIIRFADLKAARFPEAEQIALLNAALGIKRVR